MEEVFGQEQRSVFDIFNDWAATVLLFNQETNLIQVFFSGKKSLFIPGGVYLYFSKCCLSDK